MHIPTRRYLLAAAVIIAAVSPRASGAAAGSIPITSQVLTSTSSVHKIVALTFDDGPSSYTPEVLALLRRYHAHATFFVIGVQVSLQPVEVRAELQDGNDVGDHTFTHPNLQSLSDSQIAWQLQTTQDAIHQAAGATTHWFRPPYGAVDQRVSGIAASLGLQAVTWSVDPRDWSLPGSDAIVQRVLSAVEPGSIVIMHDGGGDRSETVAALAAILPVLQARGYRMVTLDDLFYPQLQAKVAQRCPDGGCQASPKVRGRHAGAKRAPPSHQGQPSSRPAPPNRAQACKALKRAPPLPGLRVSCP